jgi:DNA-binding transcriptional ArsR family regulator
MEPDPAPQAETKAELPSQFAAQLSATARDALGHPVRRQILRTLNASAEPRSPSEIAALALPHVDLSVVNYHAKVLEAGGRIELSGTRQVDGGVARLYASRVADDEQVAAVLQATRGLDRWATGPR